jgi:hypothetical protein
MKRRMDFDLPAQQMPAAAKIPNEPVRVSRPTDAYRANYDAVFRSDDAEALLPQREAGAEGRDAGSGGASVPSGSRESPETD